MEDQQEFDIGLGLEGTHVMITGAAGMIGSVVTRAFLACGCFVTAIDLDSSKLDKLQKHKMLQCIAADTTDEKMLEKAFEDAAGTWGVFASVVIATAGLDLSFLDHHASMADMPLQQWTQTMKVNGQGTFLTALTWIRGIRRHADAGTRNISLILFGSEAGTFGVRSNADYAASKSLSAGLCRSLAPDVAAINPLARVNVIAPGPVDTLQFQKECAEDPQARWVESEATVALKTPVPIEAVARACIFLSSSSFSGSVTGKTIEVDGGKSGKLFNLPDGNPC